MPNTEQKARLVAAVRERSVNTADGPRAELECLLMEELTFSLTQLATNVDQAKTILGTRVQELTEELKASSASAGQQAGALVRWTKVLAWVTGAYALFAAFQVVL